MAVGKEVRFTGNTKIMYDKIIGNVPWFGRKSAQAKLDRAIDEVCVDGVVTDADMVVLAKKTTPRIFLQTSLDIIEEHKTS
eukprot:CAMPEP_0181082342 /NCGR_PEP_ID=MMETSP1071-20121207/3572_1 /TAXON_ID=35127 /ORGANISM="Thalassiosira sp., Strain NH16" /LENGTH=80 /DNA_ID=CAMNT_0023163925 /DNA_START=101 /DNA_END=343 /DNA_ORIENTATION=-